MMKSCKFLLIMLVLSMLCFSVVAVPENQMPIFSGQKLKANEKSIIDSPLFSNEFEGAFKTIINHFIIIIPMFLMKVIHNARCENLEIENNCVETDIDNDFEEDISERKIESVTINDNNEETKFQDFEDKVEDNEIVEEIITEDKPEDKTKENDNEPIQDDFINEEEDDEKEDPIDNFNLEFTLDLDEVYAYQEPIPVTAIIKNNGEKCVELCEMDVKIRSLDFEIETPAGNIIHYIGPYEGKGEAIKLAPFQSISYKINLTSTNVSFGERNDGPMGLFNSYNFPPGFYTIKGFYFSFQTITAESSSYFQGDLYSPSYNFEIREGPTPK